MPPVLTLPSRSKQPIFRLGRRSGIAGRAIKLTERELFHHMLLLGTTGSGKTTAAMSVLTQAIHGGWGVVMLDLKGDPDNAAQLAGAARDAGCAYRQFSFTPGERCDRWQPLEAGDPAARMSKVICLSQWSEPYYQSACERFAQLAFVLMDRNEQRPTFEALIDLLDTPAKAMPLAQTLPVGERGRIEQYLTRLLADRGQMSALAGLAARIGTLTDLGGSLRSTNTSSTLELAALSASGGVACFSLNSARSQVTAAQLGALAVLDIQSMVAKRIASGQITRPVIVCVDEFSALEADQLLGLFARARSSRVAMMLATQELSDLARVREGFADQILGLANTKLLMRQELASSAETLAQLAGTTTRTKRTEQTDRKLLISSDTGMGTRRDVEEFVVHPNTFKRLRRGEAVLIRKDPFRVERLNVTPHVAPPDTAATLAPTAPPTLLPAAPAAPAPEPPPTLAREDLDRLFADRAL